MESHREKHPQQHNQSPQFKSYALVQWNSRMRRRYPRRAPAGGIPHWLCASPFGSVPVLLDFPLPCVLMRQTRLPNRSAPPPPRPTPSLSILYVRIPLGQPQKQRRRSLFEPPAAPLCSTRPVRTLFQQHGKPTCTPVHVVHMSNRSFAIAFGIRFAPLRMTAYSTQGYNTVQLAL